MEKTIKRKKKNCTSQISRCELAMHFFDCWIRCSRWIVCVAYKPKFEKKVARNRSNEFIDNLKRFQNPSSWISSRFLNNEKCEITLKLWETPELTWKFTVTFQYLFKINDHDIMQWKEKTIRYQIHLEMRQIFKYDYKKFVYKRY